MEALIVARAVAGMGGGGCVQRNDFCKAHCADIYFRVMTGMLGAVISITKEIYLVTVSSIAISDLVPL